MTRVKRGVQKRARKRKSLNWQKALSGEESPIIGQPKMR